MTSGLSNGAVNFLSKLVDQLHSTSASSNSSSLNGYVSLLPSSASSSSSSSSSLGSSKQNAAAFGVNDGDPGKTLSISFVSEWDMLILRFALQLHNASDSALTFSARRYGYITGQLTLPNAEDVPGKEEKSKPTDEWNVEERLFMCLSSGSYSVERALVVLQSQESPALRNLTIAKVLRNNGLSIILIKLSVAIHHEHRWFSGNKTVPRYVFNEMPKTQQTHIDAALTVVSSASFSSQDQPSEESLQPAEQTVRSQDDPMTKQEIQHYLLLQHKSFTPLHHLLRICLDATFTKESSFMLMAFSGGVPQFIWDVPPDIPLDSLSFHTQKDVAAAIQQQALYLYQLMHSRASHQHKASSSYYSSSSSSSSSRSFLSSKDALFQWILKQRTRTVLFANMVACQLFSSAYEYRTVNTKRFILNRLNTNIDAIAKCFLSTLQ